MQIEDARDGVLFLDDGSNRALATTHGWRILKNGASCTIDVDFGDAMVAVTADAVARVEATIDALLKAPGDLPFSSQCVHGRDGALTIMRVVGEVRDPAWPGGDDVLSTLVRDLRRRCPELRIRAHQGALSGFFAVADAASVDPDEPISIILDRREHALGIEETSVTVRFAATRRRAFADKDIVTIGAFVRDVLDDAIVVARAGETAWWCRRRGSGLTVLGAEATTSWVPLHPEVRSFSGTADRNLGVNEIEALTAAGRPPALLGQLATLATHGLLKAAGFERTPDGWRPPWRWR